MDVLKYSELMGGFIIPLVDNVIDGDIEREKFK